MHSAQLDESDPVFRIKMALVAPDDPSATTLRSTISEVHPARLAGFSNQVRSHQNYVRAFDELSTKQGRWLINEHPDPIAAAIALSMHRDGHIRQLSVQVLNDSTDPIVVPFLLLRTGEWVGSIRDVARSALDPWIHVDNAAVLLRSFPLFHGARFASGRPAWVISERAVEVLRSPKALAVLLANIDEVDLITSRTAVRFAADQGATITLLELALETRDVVCTGNAARVLPTEGPLNQQAGELLWNHPTARLRQEGVFRLLKHGGDRSEVVAVAAMCDRSESVRSTAQRWFRGNDRDCPDFYRSLSPADRLPALLGLGDDADESDAAVARASLGHSPAIRRAALRLLARLGDPHDESVFVEAFQTGTSRERRLALAWFRRTGVTAALIQTMWSLPSTDEENDEVKVRMLTHLAPMTTVWDQIELALRAVNAGNEAVRRGGAALLHRVANQPSGFRVRPDPEHLGQLRSAFEKAQPAFDAGLADLFPRTDFVHRIDQLLSN